MRPFARFIGVVTLLAFVGAGCSSFTSGQPIVAYKKGGPAIVQTAPTDGQYALYSKFDATPKATYSLKEGDKMGFQQLDGGKVKAVAGDQSVDLPEGNYLFKKKTK
jgi:hypothetical protein